jgi:hypothetical protein
VIPPTPSPASSCATACGKVELIVIAVPGRGLPISVLEVTIELIQVIFIICSIIIVKDRIKKSGSKKFR